jgi:hypothetical protein
MITRKYPYQIPANNRTRRANKCRMQKSARRADFIVDSSQSFDHRRAQVRDKSAMADITEDTGFRHGR